MSDTLYLLAASYDVEDALAEYDAIQAVYQHVGSSHDLARIHRSGRSGPSGRGRRMTS
jgi:hypothetical protein